MQIRTALLSLAAISAFGVTSPVAAGDVCGNLKQLSLIEITIDSGGRPVVPVMINGRPKSLLLDTGSVISTLTQETVEELALNPVRRNDIVLYDIDGNRIDRSVTLPSITVGQIRGNSWRFWVHAPGRRTGSTPSETISGLLAPDLLRQFDVDLDFAHKTLKLFSPDHCEGRVLYWMPSALAVIPMEVDPSGHVYVSITIDGQRIRAMIDTGASSTLMNLTVARRRFGLTETAADNGSATHQFKSLELDGLVVENPSVRLVPDRMAEAMPFDLGGVTSETRRALPDVIIGQNVLGKLHLYIAYRERKLYVTD